MAAVKADPAAQRLLLDLQAVDTSTAQHQHRRRTLPELAAIEQAAARLATLTDDAVRIRTRVSDLERDQRRLEIDVEQVRARSDRDQQRLTSGAVSNGKELERLQSEVASLARRQGFLEEQVLEFMEQREGMDHELAALDADAQTVRSEHDAAVTRRDAAWVELDEALADRAREREMLLPQLPPDLVTLYERVRGSSGGSGAAALKQRRCEGCRMEMARTALNRIRDAAPEEVLRCEECGRILVRTPESGL